MSDRCIEIALDGKRCRATAVPGCSLCAWHMKRRESPEQRRERERSETAEQKTRGARRADKKRREAYSRRRKRAGELIREIRAALVNDRLRTLRNQNKAAAYGLELES